MVFLSFGSEEEKDRIIFIVILLGLSLSKNNHFNS